MSETTIKVPDIGGDGSVEVIEISVAVGDQIEAEQTLIVLESDKASMEIPSPQAGVVKAVNVAVGDKVSEGSVFITLETEESAAAPTASEVAKEEFIIICAGLSYRKKFGKREWAVHPPVIRLETSELVAGTVW